jgi:hypothetical protein
MNHLFAARILATTWAVAVLSSAGPAFAQDSDCVSGLTSMQQRLLAKADEGPEALRRFIDIRRAILQIDILETMEWAEAWRMSKPACHAALAADPRPLSVVDMR